jgi:hypothetical protein
MPAQVAIDARKRENGAGAESSPPPAGRLVGLHNMLADLRIDARAARERHYDVHRIILPSYRESERGREVSRCLEVRSPTGRYDRIESLCIC